LLANIHQISKGQASISVIDYENGNDVTIKLKETNSPNQNVNMYFDKAKDEKINYGKSLELYNQSLNKYDLLIEQKSIFESTNSISKLREIKDQLKIGTVRKLKKETKLDIRYKHYRIDDKYDVYVGKDSKSNDMLSTKFAKQNDYWFHARGLPGSHVILRSDKPKEVVPNPVLKKAAAIAAFQSEATTACIVPVSYTFAKFVYKKKGLEPGQVFLTKEKVLTVQPGIPSDCEIINE
jgi:predicted ribosome quality control (RQC) complex YloA/Tae2 family protein